jgi:hypothetical protein
MQIALIRKFRNSTTRNASTPTTLGIRTRDHGHDFVARIEEGSQTDRCDIRRTGKDQAHRLKPT